MSILPRIKAFLRLERRSSLIEIDPKTFKKGECKEVRRWSWKTLSNRKFIVTLTRDDKFLIEEIK